MRLWNLIISEIARRKRSFAIGILAVAVATGTLVAAVCSLRAHDARTEALLLQKEQQTRAKMEQMETDIKQAMEHLGFNMIILPEGQETGNWYAQNYAAKTMPAGNARELAAADIAAISEIMPVLRQKIVWPETDWTVILVGKGAVRGAAPIERGQVRLGHEIHAGLGIAAGETVEIDGKSFQVEKCLPEQGDQGDVTIAMNLQDVQKLTGNAGRINEIHVREYRGGWKDLAAAKDAILAVLPDKKIVENNYAASAKIMAFEKARQRRLQAIENDRLHRAASRATLQRFSILLSAAAMLICMVWIALLAARNIKERSGEIALMRSVGVGSRQIVELFLGRMLALAVTGGIAGYLAGGMAAPADWPGGLQMLSLAVLTALILTCSASLAPILQAVRRDPATVFQEAE